MTIPLQSASLYDRQEVFVWSNCLLDFGTDFLVCSMEEELAKLVERLNKASTAYGMEISAEKTQADDKQHQWHQHRDQSKWTEA